MEVSGGVGGIMRSFRQPSELCIQPHGRQGKFLVTTGGRGGPLWHLERRFGHW